MAHQGSFSSAHSSVGSTSPASSTSAVSVSSSSPATVSFSVFQEGPGRALVFAPPLGTPELQALVDLFIALDVPVSMKMEMIQRDFEAHTARTNERYKTYFVPSAASTPNAASATITSPSTYTASPSPIFHNVFDAHVNHQHPASSSAGSGSGSNGSMYLDASPVPRPSPTESDLTVASDSLFPLSVPMFPTHQFNDINAAAAFVGNFYPVVDHSPVAMSAAAAAASMWSAAPLTATAAPAARRSSQQTRQSAPAPSQQRRRLSGSSSMQILTRTGEDVTHMSSRGTRTHEERENTRLVRQRGACPDCRRKKTRCNPDHAGFVAEASSSVSARSSARSSARAGPYAAPAQSGRAKAEAAAAKAAKASKAKVEGKKAVTASEPVFVAAPQQAPSAAVLAGIEDGGGGGLGHIPPLDLSLFADSFDWDQLITEEDLELSIATTLSMTMPTTTTASASGSASNSGTTQAHIDSYSIPPFRPPPPHRPTDAARFQSRRNLNVATTVSPLSVSANTTSAAPLEQAPQMGRMINTAAAGFTNFAGQDAFANNNAGNDNTSFFGDASPGSASNNSTSAADNFFGTVDASMTGSCVQPGFSQTGGLTHGSALRTLRPLLERTDRDRDLSRLDGDGDQGERESYCEADLAGERRSVTLEDRDREHDTLTASRSRIATLATKKTRQRRIDDPDHGRLMSFQDQEQGEQLWSTEGERSSSRVTRNRLQTIGATSVSSTSSPTSSTSSSTTSSLSPSDALMLLTVIVNFAASLLPAYQAWTAAAHEAEEAHDDSLDLSVQLDRMNLGPALVSCQ